MCQRVNTLVEEKCNLEKENTDLQGMMAMLQYQNYILGDQARGYQTVAKKAAVRCAQHKYKKRRGRIRVPWKEMFQALLKAGMSLDKLDGIPTKDMWQLYEDKVKWTNWVEVQKSETEPIPLMVPSPSTTPDGIYPFEDLCKFE